MKTESLKSSIEVCKEILEDYIRTFYEPREYRDRLFLTSLTWDGTSRELSMGAITEETSLVIEAVFVLQEKIGVKSLKIYPGDVVEVRTDC